MREATNYGYLEKKMRLMEAMRDTIKDNASENSQAEQIFAAIVPIDFTDYLDSNKLVLPNVPPKDILEFSFFAEMYFTLLQKSPKLREHEFETRSFPLAYNNSYDDGVNEVYNEKRVVFNPKRYVLGLNKSIR